MSDFDQVLILIAMTIQPLSIDALTSVTVSSENCVSTDEASINFSQSEIPGSKFGVMSIFISFFFRGRGGFRPFFLISGSIFVFPNGCFLKT